MPDEIICLIPNIHSLSKSFALKIISLSNESNAHYKTLVDFASKIGTSISSPTRLQKLVEAELNKSTQHLKTSTTKQYKTTDGKLLFTFKHDQRGNPSIVLNRMLSSSINLDTFCNACKELLEQQSL